MIVAVLLGYCLDDVNRTETLLALSKHRLTIPELQVRVSATKGSILGLLKTSWKNRGVFPTAFFYGFALSIFGSLAWALSLIFVAEVVIAGWNTSNTTSMVLSSGILDSGDSCLTSIIAANCTYDLSVSALSSQLITYTPYSIAGVSFPALPNGTLGLPYDSLTQFAASTQNNQFGDEHTEYCLPILKPKVVSCATDNSRAQYTWERVLNDPALQTYVIDVDNGTSYSQPFIRTSYTNGVMAVTKALNPEDTLSTIITGSGIYANLLSQLMTGNDLMSTPDNTTQYTLVCTLEDQSTVGSWQWVSFSFSDGILGVNVTGETCDSGIYPACLDTVGCTGFINLNYAFQETAALLSGVDGYSKLINNASAALPAYVQYAQENNMTLLESSLSQLYAIVHTTWSGTDSSVSRQTPIRQRVFPHLYVISVSWTGVTILASALAALLWIAVIWSCIRWFTAMHQLRKLRRKTGGPRSFAGNEDWDILQPLPLMAFATATSGALGEVLDTKRARDAAVRNRRGPKLGLNDGRPVVDARVAVGGLVSELVYMLSGGRGMEKEGTPEKSDEIVGVGEVDGKRAGIVLIDEHVPKDEEVGAAADVESENWI